MMVVSASSLGGVGRSGAGGMYVPGVEDWSHRVNDEMCEGSNVEKGVWACRSRARLGYGGRKRPRVASGAGDRAGRDNILST